MNSCAVVQAWQSSHEQGCETLPSCAWMQTSSCPPTSPRHSSLSGVLPESCPISVGTAVLSRVDLAVVMVWHRAFITACWLSDCHVVLQAYVSALPWSWPLEQHAFTASADMFDGSLSRHRLSALCCTQAGGQAGGADLAVPGGAGPGGAEPGVHGHAPPHRAGGRPAGCPGRLLRLRVRRHGSGAV